MDAADLAAEAAAVTVVVAEASHLAADGAVSVTAVVEVVAEVASATVVDEAVAVALPVVDAVLREVELEAAGEALVVARTYTPHITAKLALTPQQQGHCRAPSPRRCLRRPRQGRSPRHQEPDARRECLRREAHQRRRFDRSHRRRGCNP